MLKNFPKVILQAFYHAAGAIIYIFLISWLMMKGPNFPVGFDALAPAFVLTLFVFSAGVMAVAFFLKPILLFLENKKKEGLWFLGLTAVWFVFLAVIIFVAVALISAQFFPPASLAEF